MDLTIWQYFLIGVLGLAAGVVNMMAGGGSNLILPMLMVFGVPADVANASNRVGVFMQSLSGLQSFKKAGRLPTEDWWPIVLPTLVGGLCGALVASFAPVALLKPMLLGAMLLVAAIAFFKPNMLVHDANTMPIQVVDKPSARFWLWLSGVYGGFVQAGAGFVLLPVLAGVLRYDLVRANALKVLCTLGFTLVSLMVFIWRGQVWWDIGLVLAVGSMIGARIGVATAIKLKPNTLRWLLFLMTLTAVATTLIF